MKQLGFPRNPSRSRRRRHHRRARSGTTNGDRPTERRRQEDDVVEGESESAGDGWAIHHVQMSSEAPTAEIRGERSEPRWATARGQRRDQRRLVVEIEVPSSIKIKTSSVEIDARRRVESPPLFMDASSSGEKQIDGGGDGFNFRRSRKERRPERERRAWD